jgi:large subunit ribosomal protein L10e
MGLRKASAYSRKYARAFTRNSRRKSKAYIKTIPHVKVAKYNIGDYASFRDKKHKFFVRLVSRENVQVRDTALEAGRMFVHKEIEEKIPGRYFFAVKVHPHHFLRNNKTSGVAGADRISTGMSHSFGVIEGRAAIVPAGKDIFMISCADENAARTARDALEAVKAKFPGSIKIVFEKVE